MGGPTCLYLTVPLTSFLASFTLRITILLLVRPLPYSAAELAAELPAELAVSIEHDGGLPPPLMAGHNILPDPEYNITAGNATNSHLAKLLGRMLGLATSLVTIFGARYFCF